MVTIVPTGETSSTDVNGVFEIASTSWDSIIELRVAHGTTVQNLTVGVLPDTTEVVDLSIKLDDAANTFSLSAISIFPEGTVAPLPTPTPEPTATPGPGKTPKPDETPDEPDGPFDSAGNTSRFGIPSGIRGNISRGRSVWNRTCSQCHLSEKSGRRFGEVRTARRTVPQMRALSLSDQTVADAVAYLNRGAR